MNQINCEQVRLKLEEECRQCKGQLLASQLRKAIAKAITDRGRTVVLCTFCGEPIVEPRLKVTIGKQVHSRSNRGALAAASSGHEEFETDF